MPEAQLPQDHETRESELSRHPVSSHEGPGPAAERAQELDRCGEHEALPDSNGSAHGAASEDVCEHIIILPPPCADDNPVVPELSSPSDAAEAYPSSALTDTQAVADAAPHKAQQGGANAVLPFSLAVISPIFSALDAMEPMPATARQQPRPGPQVDAFEIGVVLAPGEVGSSSDGETQAAWTREEEPLSLEALLDRRRGRLPLEASQSTAPVLSEKPSSPAETKRAPPDDVPEETAEKIAAEANATAAALEALKQLLAAKLPDLESGASQHTAMGDRLAVQTRSSFQPPAHVPVAPPLMLPMHAGAAASVYAAREEARRRAAMVGSFFAGFSLSWVIGAVLYMVLNAS